MLKKIYAAVMMLTLAAAAFTQSEGWQKYPLFRDKIDDVVEASNKVYYLSGGNLFSFSPEDEEAYAYTALNKLSDNVVSSIHYNYDDRYLLVVYNNCNIDLLYDDGRVVNLPEVRDAQLSVTKVVNDVAFGEGRIALATSFGIVVYSQDRMEVIESGIYNTDILAVAIHKGRLVIYYRSPEGGYYLHHSPLDQRHNSLDKFTKLGYGLYITDFEPVDDNTIVMVDRGTGELCSRTIDLEGATAGPMQKHGIYPTQPLRRCKDGYFTATATDVVAWSDGKPQATRLPQIMQGRILALRDTPARLWTADDEGISLIDISGQTPSVLYDKMLYDGAMTCTNVGYMRWSPDGKRLYVTNLTASSRKLSNNGELSDYQTTNIIEDGFSTDASIRQASASHEAVQKLQNNNSSTRMWGDSKWVVEDPDDPDKYYCANNHEGLYVIKRNPQTGKYEEIGKFNCSNSPITDKWGARVNDVNIDPQGNLWVGYRFGHAYCVLPADKRRSDPAAITRADWKEMAKIPSDLLDKADMQSVICSRSGVAILINGQYELGFVAVDTKGTYADPSDDRVTRVSTVVDQDGNSFVPTYTTFIMEDSRGCVWVGTNAGLFEITNPADVFDPAFRVKRLKVPRNDGTNYADYLLDSDQINWIAEDHSGRKWIATDASGIFLVSQAGDEIIRHYNTDNSPLATNTIHAIECDKQSNTVYVGTPMGLYSFLSDSAPAAEDYSEISVYPNPVRPDFTGDVTIAGLLDHSIVKVMDSSGSVVYQTRSEGGMATWPATNAAGARVKSGVYYIHVSSNSSGKSAGSVAKVMVIN